MEKRKCLFFLFCLILCYPLFQLSAIAQNSSGVSIFSQGNISYPSSNVNLAVMPPAGNYWGLTYGSGPQIIQLDSSVEYTSGNPSICLEPHTSADANAAREVDGTWLNVAVGDNIVASCWILCGDSSTGDTSPYAGARLGIDLYAHTSAGYGIVDSYPHDGTEDMNSFVNWGTNTWTLKTWDITIPSTYYTTDLSNGRTCNPVQIDSFVLWLQVLQPTDAGLAWFAASQLYINPT